MGAETETTTTETENPVTGSDKATYGIPFSPILPSLQPPQNSLFQQISPQAAQYLPQARNVELFDKSKIGIDIFSNPQPQVPWTALAIQQSNNQPSPNTKAMNDYLRGIAKVQKTDPRFQLNLENRTSAYLDDVHQFLTKYGSKGLTMLQTGLGYDKQSEEDVQKIHEVGGGLNAYAGMGEFTGKAMDAYTKAKGEGKLVNPDTPELLKQFDELRNDYSSNSDVIEKMNTFSK